MQVPGRTFRQWLDRGIGSAVPLLVVLIAVMALPGCPRVAGMEATSEDTRTVTEQRPVTQTFSQPGHYLLHQTEMSAEPCATCEEPADGVPSGTTSQPVVTVDVLPKATDVFLQLAIDGTERLPGMGASSMHAGFVSSVPAPPPRAA
jgi:hypothetical protein